jgi:hypothetical protein
MERHLAHMVARGVLRQEDAGDVLAYLRDKTIRSDPSEIAEYEDARVRDIALTALLEDPEILKILKKRQRDPGRE